MLKKCIMCPRLWDQTEVNLYFRDSLPKPSTVVLKWFLTEYLNSNK